MHKLKPYAETKDSGVEWLGDVPEHWGVVRLGSVLRERGEVNTDNRVTEVLSVLKGRGVIPYSEKGNIGNKKSDDITRYKIVRPGDIVMNCMNVIIGSVGMASHTGCLSPVYYVLVGRGNENAHYLNLIFQCPQFYKSLVRIGNGILAHRMRIPMELLKCEMFPIPPLAEQGAIVRYLGFVEARVRRLLAAKQKTVELLLEKRQTTIHQAVVRGLNPQVSLKDSGVEWLGAVPAHWDVRRIRDSISDSTSGVWGNDPDGINDVACVRVADFDRFLRRVRRPIPTTRAITANERKKCMLQPGDLLLEKSGGGDTQPVGAVVLFDHKVPAVFSNFIVRLRVRAEYKSEYLLHLHFMLYTLRIHTKSIKQTTGIQNLDLKSYLNEKVAFPPLDEQIAIAEHLDKVTGDIDRAIAGIRREIELLNEYRTRLIADVVTGKVDVRRASLPLSTDGKISAGYGN